MSTPIEPEDIKYGDLIRKEYFPNVEGTIAREYVAAYDGDSGPNPGVHFLLHRDIPPVVLPTDDGVYFGASGEVWELLCGDWATGGDPQTWDDVRRDAPFTRLEPVPVTVEKFVAKFREGWDSSVLKPSEYLDYVAAEFGVTE
jgi:hypothetical protein